MNSYGKEQWKKQQKKKAIIIVSIIAAILFIISGVLGYILYNWDSDGDGVRNRDDLFPHNAQYQTFSDLNFQWANISAGTFLMGSNQSKGSYSDKEYPQHSVTISKDFQMLIYEVTQSQWKAVMGNNPSHLKGKNNPVEVTWTNSQSFISKLNKLDPGHGYRLPTEAEWEYCCRAGSDTDFCFGDNESLLGNYAWYRENANSQSAPVGLKKPNAWGLYDMHGNVWEWCEDWWDIDYYKHSPEIDPKGPASGTSVGNYIGPLRVVRGGSWTKGASICRSTYRGGHFPDLYEEVKDLIDEPMIYDIGLRLVRSE